MVLRKNSSLCIENEQIRASQIHITIITITIHIYLFTQHLKIEKLGLAINIMIAILQSFTIQVYKMLIYNIKPGAFFNHI